jgi:hypothetical protein
MASDVRHHYTAANDGMMEREQIVLYPSATKEQLRGKLRNGSVSLCRRICADYTWM